MKEHRSCSARLTLSQVLHLLYSFAHVSQLAYRHSLSLILLSKLVTTLRVLASLIKEEPVQFVHFKYI